jgi:hypothetical protein
MLLAQCFHLGEPLHCISCGTKMRHHSCIETSGKQKGTSAINSRNCLILVRKYQRILPRPPESYGQPLSIISKREGAETGILFPIHGLISRNTRGMVPSNSTVNGYI